MNTKNVCEEALNERSAPFFVLVRDSFAAAPQPLVYMNPCRPAALALISGWRGTRMNRRRPAEKRLRIEHESGQVLTGKARDTRHWQLPTATGFCLSCHQD